MALKKTPGVELDADLENDLLEWSEDHNIENNSLVSLFNILKAHNFKKNENEPPDITTNDNDEVIKSTLTERLDALENGQQFMINELLKLNNSKSSTSTFKTESVVFNQKLLSKLPCQTSAEFLELEEKCKKKTAVKDEIRSFFLNCQKTDLNIFVNLNLHMLLKDECAIKFSWSGTSNTIAVKHFAIINALKECAEEKFSESLENVSSSVINWFQRASERGKYKTSTISDTAEDNFEIKAKTETDESNDEEKEDLSFLPCKTPYELKQFEATCKNNAFLEDKLRTLFLTCNKYGATNFVDINMRKLISDDLVQHISWTGINSKICLRNLLIVKVLIDVTLEKFNLECNEKVINLIRQWIYSVRDKSSKNLLTKIEKNDQTTIEMEFIDPLNMPYQEEYEYFEIDNSDITYGLPCTTEDQYESLQKNLDENRKSLNDLKDYFLKTKNLDYKSFTDYNMRQMITDNVAVTLKLSSIKDHLSTQSLKEAIFETFPEVSDFEAIDAIKIFLYKAQDRHRKKQLRIPSKLMKNVKYEILTNENQSLDCFADENDDEPDIEEISSLPCSTFRQFVKFEKRFRSDENLKLELKELFLQEIDEGSSKRFIDINIKKILDDEATVNCVWGGIGYSSPISLKNFGVIKLLRECAQETFPHMTTDLINDDIRSFLYRTKERLKRKGIKNEGTQYQSLKRRRFNRINVKIEDESFNIFGLERSHNFPLNSNEDFEDFERKCQDNEDYPENLELFFKKMKNCDSLTFIDKNLRKLITDEVSGSFTWHGRQGNKSAKDFTSIKVLKDCVENIYSNITEREIIESFTRTFRRAKDRKFHLRKHASEHEMKIEMIIKNDEILNFEGNSNESFKDQDNESESDSKELDMMNLTCLPFRSVDDFIKFEKCCRKNVVLQKKLKHVFDNERYMLDPKKFTADNLKKMLPDDLAAQFSYAGQQQNISIKHYTTMRILRESTMKRYNLVEAMATSILKRCFYMVKDRVRIRFKKKIKADDLKMKFE